jgi:hypothetical protein
LAAAAALRSNLSPKTNPLFAEAESDETPRCGVRGNRTHQKLPKNGFVFPERTHLQTLLQTA